MRALSIFMSLILTTLCWLTAGTPLQAATSQLKIGQTCSDVAAKMTLTWDGNNPAASQQWIDLSESDNGWQDGTYVSAGPIAGSDRAYTWPGLMPATQHYIRVDEQEADGSWQFSPTFSFMTCGTPIVLAQLPTGLPRCQKVGTSLSPGERRILAPAPGTPANIAAYLGGWEGSRPGPDGTAFLFQSVSAAKAGHFDVQPDGSLSAQHVRVYLSSDLTTLYWMTVTDVGSGGSLIIGPYTATRCDPA